MELEAAILLEFARLRFAQARTEDGRPRTEESSVVRHRSSVEAFDFAHEALAIAERCEYRLQLAEIHNFLAEWWLAAKDEGGRQKDELLNKAHEHAERAKERAWCDGPPYHYKVAYERAEQLLKEIQEKSS